MYEDYIVGLKAKAQSIIDTTNKLESATSSSIARAIRQINLANATSVYKPNQPMRVSSSGSMVSLEPDPPGVYGNNGQTLEKIKETNTWELPNYDPAKLVIKTPDKTVEVDFLLGVNSVSQSRSNMVVPNKTNGGWFIYRLGPNLMQLTFNGNLLDTAQAAEKAGFLEIYKGYIEDQKDKNSRYYNENIVTFYVQGFKYIGYITSLQIMESADRLFLASYSIGMIVVKDVNVAATSMNRIKVKDNIVAVVKPQDQISDDLSIILNLSEYGATE